jgi:hypothetical protein
MRMIAFNDCANEFGAICGRERAGTICGRNSAERAFRGVVPLLSPRGEFTFRADRAARLITASTAACTMCSGRRRFRARHSRGSFRPGAGFYARHCSQPRGFIFVCDDRAFAGFARVQTFGGDFFVNEGGRHTVPLREPGRAPGLPFHGLLHSFVENDGHPPISIFRCGLHFQAEKQQMIIFENEARPGRGGVQIPRRSHGCATCWHGSHAP